MKAWSPQTRALHPRPQPPLGATARLGMGPPYRPLRLAARSGTARCGRFGDIAARQYRRRGMDRCLALGRAVKA